ncbi:hypothetical protein J7E97_22600 [Streptomyces sp. ISL-66]|uniref:hypothetical protein n=1 Tax=Streptomyces sp. ISL-66 TaxID=2819186 RepID=UPI001BE52819|nr:hypothetical protein [Streptomyces sp. ISL-66]MBT2470580.1 hypothetical protein [Streptomyces sp. ISL-66]
MSDPTVPRPRVPQARRLITFLAAAVLTAAASAAASAAPSAPDLGDGGLRATGHAAGKAAALRPVRAVGEWRSTGPSGEQSARVKCPAGYYATGGGAESDGGRPHLSTSIAVPQQTDSADGWAVTARNYSTQGGMSIRA